MSLNPDEYLFSDVAQQRAWLESGRTSAVELADLAHAALVEHAAPLSAIATLATERAKAEAHAVDAAPSAYDRALRGIPYGAKDLLATHDLPTTWGVPFLRDQQFAEDATVLRLLGAAGAVLAAKLSMVEFAGIAYEQPNASISGPGKNPHDPDYWAGGSSSGSGSAVGCGALPFAIGTETWGSILTPASYCGIVGFRPTFGLVSRYGAMALSWSMDKIGAMAHSVQDCIAVMQVIGVPDKHDPQHSGRRFAYNAEKYAGKRWRIGILEDEIADSDPDVARAHEAQIARLEALGTVERVTLPDLPYNEVAATVILAEAGSALEDFIESGQVSELAAPEGRVIPYAFHAIRANDYIRALRVRSRIAAALADLLTKYDVLVAPATQNTATGIATPHSSESDTHRRNALSAASNLAGLPAISLPIGRDAKGLPIGMSLVGDAFADGDVLHLAAQLDGTWERRIERR